jgi:hypothetical protein
MGEALLQNHTILGIHLTGNQAIVDELGYVKPDTEEVFMKQPALTRLPRKFSFKFIRRHLADRNDQGGSHE